MFVGLWRIVKETQQPLHKDLIGLSINEYPYTINFVIKKRLQIESFLELPKESRPPKSIWDKPSELEEWFERVYSSGKSQTEFNLPIRDGELEE